MHFMPQPQKSHLTTSPILYQEPSEVLPGSRVDPIVQWMEYKGHFVKRPHIIGDLDMVISGKCNQPQEQ